MPSHTPVSVVLSRFEDIVALGLQRLIEEDPSLELCASGVPPEGLTKSLGTHHPQVAILNYGSLTNPTELGELSRTYPETRLVVLANVGNPGYPSALLEIGAVEAAASTLGFEVAKFEIRRSEDIAPGFEAVIESDHFPVRPSSYGWDLRPAQCHAHRADAPQE